MGDPGGRFVWYELATTDIEAAKAFYSSVVGWRAEDASIAGAVFSQFTLEDNPVAGLMKLERRGEGSPAPQWLGFVGVDDVDVVAGRVRQLGGTVHVAPITVSGNNRFSVIADPETAALALVRKPQPGHAPSQKSRPLGRVGWHELLAADVERAFAFYEELFGWQMSGEHDGLAGLYKQFSSGTELLGGICTRSEASLASLWLYYFNVSDIGAAVKRAEAGGGKLLYGPVAVPGGGKVAHLMDPQGAIFALMDRTVRIAVGCYAPRSDTPAEGPGKRGPV